MFNENEIGLYGKLPAYGDFLIRNLPSPFVDDWDQWLQFYISVSQEQIGDSWLDIYLTSPIWRFVLSSGVIDDRIWCGIVMPSVDRVGRYFPISLLMAQSGSISATGLLQQRQFWFDEVEKLCLTALEESIELEELIDLINAMPLSTESTCRVTSHYGSAGAFVIGMDEVEQETIVSGEDITANLQSDSALNSAIAHSLDNSLSTHGSFSLWQTSGSELVAPVLFCCQGLPPIGGLAAMMDGQWQHHQWKIPFQSEH